ncbi:MAG: nucleoside monophosphate kinase [Candidatus Doudnabacteria bacterium]|nr:nucleoside monophosphate kinase [Candidatus Doudnabacteria bacterium]
MTKQPLNIILLGDPASGKATHGAFIAKKYKMYDLDMGRELRSISKNPVLRKKYRLDETLEKGKLTPTKIVRQILQDSIAAVPKSQGLLLNGTPKMIGEAKLVTKWLKQQKRERTIFIYLSIPLKETILRMTGRKEYFKGKFSKRPDDNNKALKNRIAYYQKNIAEVVTYFRKLYPYTKISTIGTVSEAKNRLLTILKKYENI